MNEKQGKDPAIVKDPATEDITCEPVEVKRIFNEHLYLKTGTTYGSQEREEKIWWEERMEEENAELEAAFKEMEKKSPNREYW